jgi:transketolase
MPTQPQLANAIRILAMDAVQQANSGHPGMPMGMADIAEVLWREFLQHNPENPHWVNRDRFVLSNGHGSMLLYALLHLTGYELSIDDLKNFRQLHSKTPGHPEYGYTPGIETTTGPLGQGLANAVGMALAEKALATQFNRTNFPVIDHYTYTFMGDGCLMEGISHEACSLAGTLGLGKLIAFWDDNNISIDGEVEGWFTDNTPERFRAYHWHVVAGVDGHDPEAIKAAILEAQSVSDKPSLICCKTVIGFGSPNKQGKESSHGAPLGPDEIALARKQLNWDGEPFAIPEEYYQAWNGVCKGEQLEQAWEDLFNAYCQQHPALAAELARRLSGELPDDFGKDMQSFIETTAKAGEKVASRKASQQSLEFLGKQLPELLGGSADLAGSNLTMWSGSQPIRHHDFSGNYINYGVREFAMAAMMNGIALYGGFIPYGGTFLIFSDYARNAMRMSALMKIRVIYVLTHDSIGLGEDGPTHQPIAQIATLRLIPNMQVWRPCDASETAVAWQQAVKNITGPSCLCLSRQGLPAAGHTDSSLPNIKRGGYVLRDCATTPDIILISTGSEISLALSAAEQLSAQGRAVRVVSMPCAEVFALQDNVYQESVLPAAVTRRIAIEAGVADYWYKYVGLQGRIIGMHGFGESAPAGELFAEFGFTVENIVKTATELLA